MIWITIILGIVQALPQLISLIQTIVASLHTKPNAQVEAQFHGALAAWQHTGDHVKLEQSLKAVHAAL